MKEGTTLGARAQWAIQRAAVLYKPRLATFNFKKITPGSKKKGSVVFCYQVLQFCVNMNSKF
jgi:hypothetical protein